MIYLVDTDWVINYLRGEQRTVRLLRNLYEKGLAISVITFSEIYEGIFYFESKKEKLEKDFLNFLEGVVVLAVDENIGKLFGELRADLRKDGNLLENFDLIIAATALFHNLELLSNNAKHFSRIKNLRLKSITDYNGPLKLDKKLSL